MKVFKALISSIFTLFYYLLGFVVTITKLENITFCAKISPRAKIRKGTYSLGSAVVGKNVSIGRGTYIQSGVINYVDIGEYCSISYDVKIGLSEHNISLVSTSPVYMRDEYGNATLADKKPEYAKIGSHTWIGANAIILQGVCIGEHCVIAAGSVVTKNIPSYEVWGGVPAKKIKDLE